MKGNPVAVLAHLRQLSLVVGWGCLAAAASASPPQWTPVPGAPDLEIDLQSLRPEASGGVAWIRAWGASPLLPELARLPARSRDVRRSALLTQFDCSRGHIRILAASTYGGDGRPLSMASTAGAWQPSVDAEFGWAYDAACEALRGPARSEPQKP